MVSGTNKRRQKETSKKAFRSILEDLTPREAQIYKVVKANPGITIREISVKIKRPAHTFSGRCTALEYDKKVFKVIGVKYYKDSPQPHSRYKVIK